MTDIDEVAVAAHTDNGPLQYTALARRSRLLGGRSGFIEQLGEVNFLFKGGGDFFGDVGFVEGGSGG